MGAALTLTSDEAAALVERARAGEQSAWDRLVDAYVGLVWAIARNHRLSAADAADVSQTTWLRLLEHLDRLDEPGSVGAWLATTARRECLRVLRGAKRQVLVEDDRLETVEVVDVPHDTEMIRLEEGEQVRAALAQLPDRCRVLLEMLMADPAPSYEEVSARLGMPIGSIGPTRGRCLAKLRALLAESGLDAVS